MQVIPAGFADCPGSHGWGLGSHAMRIFLRQSLFSGFVAVISWFTVGVAASSLLSCAAPASAVNPALIPILDPKPVPKPEPPDPQPDPAMDGLLELGSGERPTLSIQAFYDANSDDTRQPGEAALESAGLRLTAVRVGVKGPEKTGPGHIVRTRKDGLLIAHVPVGMYLLGFVKTTSAGSDANAAQWASSEILINLEADQAVDLPAFCQVEAVTQPASTGACAPKYELRPRASFAVVPDSITPGQTATLRFRTEDQAVVTLEPFGVVESFREKDFFERTVQPSVTTTYTLRAKNAYATREINVTLTVKP
jgi:hypothetical protein